MTTPCPICGLPLNMMRNNTGRCSGGHVFQTGATALDDPSFPRTDQTTTPMPPVRPPENQVAREQWLAAIATGYGQWLAAVKPGDRVAIVPDLGTGIMGTVTARDDARIRVTADDGEKFHFPTTTGWQRGYRIRPHLRPAMPKVQPPRQDPQIVTAEMVGELAMQNDAMARILVHAMTPVDRAIRLLLEELSHTRKQLADATSKQAPTTERAADGPQDFGMPLIPEVDHGRRH